jgi:uncharacterized membrane protein HdeD (DUF308 family)
MKKRRNNSSNELLTAVALVVIGLLFIMFKGGVISIAMSLIGITLIVLGILDVMRSRVVLGVVKLVLAALVMLAGWLFITLALYVLGAFLLVAGVGQLVALSKLKFKKLTIGVAMHFVQPIIYILVAICLFFNQGGAIDWVFTVSGILLLVDGIVGLIGALDK